MDNFRILLRDVYGGRRLFNRLVFAGYDSKIILGNNFESVPRELNMKTRIARNIRL